MKHHRLVPFAERDFREPADPEHVHGIILRPDKALKALMKEAGKRLVAHVEHEVIDLDAPVYRDWDHLMESVMNQPLPEPKHEPNPFDLLQFWIVWPKSKANWPA